MQVGDTLICKNTINNFFGQPLFIENETYKILYIDDENVVLNNILYANEYAEFDIEFIKNNFNTI
jgi:hypothetical protein